MSFSYIEARRLSSSSGGGSSSGSGSSIYDYYDFSAGIDSTTFPVCANVTLTAGITTSIYVYVYIYIFVNSVFMH